MSARTIRSKYLLTTFTTQQSRAPTLTSSSYFQNEICRCIWSSAFIVSSIRSFSLSIKENSTCELALSVTGFSLLLLCVCCQRYLEEGRCSLICFAISALCMQWKSRNFYINNNTHNKRQEKPSETSESSKKPVIVSSWHIHWPGTDCMLLT